MKQQPPEGVSASPIGDDNLLVWGGTVFGPDDTPWEGGIFSLRMTFTEQYPDKPPRVRFTSEMVRALATSRARSRRRAPGCIVPCVRPRLLPAASRMRRGSADSDTLPLLALSAHVPRALRRLCSSTRTSTRTGRCAWT